MMNLSSKHRCESASFVSKLKKINFQYLKIFIVRSII